MKTKSLYMYSYGLTSDNVFVYDKPLLLALQQQHKLVLQDAIADIADKEVKIDIVNKCFFSKDFRNYEEWKIFKGFFAVWHYAQENNFFTVVPYTRIDREHKNYCMTTGNFECIYAGDLEYIELGKNGANMY